jgi:hypothetical protein
VEIQDVWNIPHGTRIINEVVSDKLELLTMLKLDKYLGHIKKHDSTMKIFLMGTNRLFLMGKQNQ